MNGQSVKPSQFPGPYLAIVTKWAKSFVPAGSSQIIVRLLLLVHFVFVYLVNLLWSNLFLFITFPFQKTNTSLKCIVKLVHLHKKSKEN
jgi:hypothetical protein